MVIVALREYSHIDTKKFITTLLTVLGSLIDRINDMGVIVAKAKSQHYERAGYFTQAVVAEGKILVVGDMLHLLSTVTSSHKYRINTLVYLLLYHFKQIVGTVVLYLNNVLAAIEQGQRAM